METPQHNQHHEQLDILSLYILHLLTDGVLWKNRIHERLPDKGPDLLQSSLQTVGRRVDDLYDCGYLESCVTQGENVNRDLLIGFRTTDQGTAALEQHDICTDCDHIHPAWEHTHDLVDISTYFSEA
jgi:hypothetical protein